MVLQSSTSAILLSRMDASERVDYFIRRPLAAAPKVISFDLDGTLWHVEPVLLRANDMWHEYCEIHYPEITRRYTVESFRQFVLDLAHRPEFHAHAHNYTTMRRSAIQLVATECGYPAPEVAEELLRVWRNARNLVTPFDGVAEMLRELKACGYIIATLTNGNCQASEVSILHEVGDLHLNTDSAGGFPKPHPAMFKLMLERLGVRAEEVIHVGDDLIADVRGASQVGIATIWTDYSRKWHEMSALVSAAQAEEAAVETGEGGTGGIETPVPASSYSSRDSNDKPPTSDSGGEGTTCAAPAAHPPPALLRAIAAAHGTNGASKDLPLCSAVVHSVAHIPRLIEEWTRSVTSTAVSGLVKGE